jgi:hypothetical protein
MSRWGLRKRERDSSVSLDEKARTTTVPTGLVSHVRHEAVVRMVEIGCEAWDRVTCFGNDVVHSFIQTRLWAGLPLPDLGGKPFWQIALSYVINRGRPNIPGYPTDQVHQQMRADFFAHFDEHFSEHDTIRRGYHSNFIENMATAEATNYGVFAQMETLNDHLVMYLRGRYQLRYKGWALALAKRIVAPEPLNYRTMPEGLVQEKGNDWINLIIAVEAASRNQFFQDHVDNGPLRYRFWMLCWLVMMDHLATQEDSIPVKKFSLIPFHACGSTRFASFDGNTMNQLLPKIRYTHREFYDQAKAIGPFQLNTYFRAPKKNGWQRGRQVKSNGVELHTLFERGYEYMQNGRPKKMAKNRVAQPQDFDLPTPPILCDQRDIAAIDPGYHNIFSAVRWTGELDEHGERVFAKRFVTKKWYDRRSGRKTLRQRAAARTSRAQNQGLMDAITQHTLKTTDPDAFRRAIIARRDSYAALYAFNNNMRYKKLKFAMRQRTQRAIDQLVDYISWGGAAVCVVGDCSKTTGFRGSTPGGPVQKIKRLMVKKGMRVVEEKEGYSTKSSVCCHGAENKCMKNGHSIQAYKNGKFLETPAKMPRKVHGILICQRCKRTWNRDVVGAVNILDIYLARMYGLPRPQRFTRAYWQHH